MRLWKSHLGIILLVCAWGNAEVFNVTAALQDRPSGPPTSQVAPVSARDGFSGTFRYSGGAPDEQARRAAIDSAVQKMSFVIRSAARSRITETTQILETYSFSFEPGKIVVQPQSRPVMISGSKGEPASYSYKGKESKLTQVMDGHRLTQVFVSEDGKRENEFTLSEDAQTLKLKVTLSSARLSTPVTYVLPYRRAEPGK